MATREIVISLRLSEGSTREQFRALKSALIDVSNLIRENNKDLRDNAKQQRVLSEEIKLAGVATEGQAARLTALVEKEKELKLTAANLAIAQKTLSANSRELINDASGLTDAHLRFRDKMAQATLEALKQDGILGKLGARMEFLARETDRLNKELQDGVISQEQFTSASNKLEAETKELGVQISALDVKLDALQKEFLEGRITAEEFRTQTNALNTSVQQVGGAISRGVTDLKNFALGFVGVVAAAQAAISAIRSISRTVAEFDQQLANIRALGAEYAASIDRIAKAAVDLGPKLGVAPVEALKGFEALAKAGLTTEQILNGGLQAALTLTAAGEVEVGEAAETTAAALTQFNLKGEQAVFVTDLLAKGANIAQGNVSDFAAALNQSGLVASQFGLSIEETIGGLTTFAKAGLIGSDAGTSFRQALLRLQNPTEKAADVMAQYGIVVTNANGEFLSLAEIAGQLQSKLSDLTEAQRGAALATIFGQDAIRVANILYREGADGVARYTREVNDSGFATGVANQKLNSLKGTVKQLSSAWDAFVLGIERGDGAIAKFIQAGLNGIRDLLGLITTDQLEADIDSFATKARKKFTDIFSSSVTFDADGAVLDIRQQIESLNKAFQNEALKVNAILSQDAEFIANRIADYAAEAKNISEAGADITNEQRLRFAVIATAVDTLTEGLKKQQEQAKATGAAVVETAGEEASAFGGVNQESKNAAGSVADLNAQIDELKKRQEQSTDSAQFATYQAQIDKLNQSVDLLTGKISQDMLDAADQAPQFVEPSFTQAPLPDAEPVETAQARVDALFAVQEEGQFQSLDSLLTYFEARKALALSFTEEETQLFTAAQAAQLTLQNAQIDGIGALGNAFKQLSKDQSTAFKVGLAIEKAAAIASIIINLQKEIAAINAKYAPIIGGQAIAGAESTAAGIRAGISIATILAQTIGQFDKGGYTTPGPKLKPVGVVHAGEWVAPQWQVKHPIYGRIIEFLEGGRRQRGDNSIPFASGGLGFSIPVKKQVSPGFTTAPTAAQILSIQGNAIQSAFGGQQPVLVLEDLARGQKRVAISEQLTSDRPARGTALVN